MRGRCLTTAWVLVAVLALLAPAAGAGARPTTDYVLLVDNTGTMRYHGRAQMTLAGLSDFIDLMRPGDRVSVYSFGEGARPVLPAYPVVVDDQASKDRIASQIAISFGADRTDITAGVEQVWIDKEHVFPSRWSSAPESERSLAVIVLLTDGKLIPVYTDYSQYERIYGQSRARLKELAALFGEDGVPIHTIGLGREEKIDGELLQEIADLSGGTYRHVASADGVSDAYLGAMEVVQRQREEAADEHARDEEWDALATARPHPPSEIMDQASAKTGPVDQEGHEIGSGAAASESRVAGGIIDGALERFPTGVCRTCAGILGALVGVIAVGVERKKQWAMSMHRHLFGTAPKRVRGYLAPVDSPGVFTARANIGLENPGLESVAVGAGTPYATYAQETTVEFMGTRDGTPPELHVLNGAVTVNGSAVESVKLEDGDEIVMENLKYRYLRGNRK